MTQIPGITADWVSGYTHRDLIEDNSLAFTQRINDCFGETLAPLADTSMCKTR